MAQPLWKTVLPVSYKTNCILTAYRPTIMFLGICNRAEKICLPKNLPTDVYSSFIH